MIYRHNETQLDQLSGHELIVRSKNCTAASALVLWFHSLVWIIIKWPCAGLVCTHIQLHINCQRKATISDWELKSCTIIILYQSHSQPLKQYHHQQEWIKNYPKFCIIVAVSMHTLSISKHYKIRNLIVLHAQCSKSTLRYSVKINYYTQGNK